MTKFEMRLGLVGTNISRSLAPRLHGLLGQLHGISVRYDLLDAAGVAAYDPVQVVRKCQSEGYTGVNVTHPYKRALQGHVQIADPRIARLGSINTVELQGGAWQATNTDFTGFLRAYGSRFGARPPGTVLMLGAGGVGRSVAYGLAELGATRILLHDPMPGVGDDLAAAVTRETRVPVESLRGEAIAVATHQAQGFVNCTPIGMHSYPGNPFPELPRGGERWAFDAIYTPLWTPFLESARRAGMETLSGFELFLFQGLDAFRFFTGLDVPPDAVRNTAERWLQEREG